MLTGGVYQRLATLVDPRVRFLVKAEGISKPPQPPHGEIQVWKDVRGSGALYCQARGNDYWIWWPGLAAYCFDLNTGRVDALAEPLANRNAVINAYWRYILPITEHVQGKECLHASAVQGSSGLMVFCGESRNGKSTIAYGLSERGYVFWADDAVVFESVDGNARAFPIPFAIHLRSETLSYFGLVSNARELRSKPEENNQSSSQVILAIFLLERRPAIFEGKICDSYKVRPHEALTTLLTHARCFSLKDFTRKAQMLNHYIQLVKTVPVFRLRFKSGLTTLPAVLDQIENEVGSSGLKPPFRPTGLI